MSHKSLFKMEKPEFHVEQIAGSFLAFLNWKDNKVGLHNWEKEIYISPLWIYEMPIDLINISWHNLLTWTHIQRPTNLVHKSKIQT